MTLKLAPNVIVLPALTTLDIPTERVLMSAMDSKLKGCFVIGVTQEGEMYFASSMADGGDVLWWMEKAKCALMKAE